MLLNKRWRPFDKLPPSLKDLHADASISIRTDVGACAEIPNKTTPSEYTEAY